jgi:cellulose synthase/poly-beta-1,6-N-acetylglucosamine synthase-like glycosyltransferase
MPDSGLPSVAILVAAHNEGITSLNVRTICSLDYPADRLWIFIGSDGSTDRSIEVSPHLE